MMVFLDNGITPDKLTEDGQTIYKEDLIDIIAAKKLMSEGDTKRNNRMRAKERVKKIYGK